VRGTTRSVEGVAAIEAAGAEAWVGDPDRLATLFPALDHVSVAFVLLGSATGQPQALAALHRDRLESLVFKMVDTTIRVVVYEACGSVDPELLQSGEAIVTRLCSQNRMLFAFMRTDPGDHERWLADALDAMQGALAR
jgi:hypothetical protein